MLPEQSESFRFKPQPCAAVALDPAALRDYRLFKSKANIRINSTAEFMVRLRIEGNPGGLQEILLKPGLNRLGRIEDNDIQIGDQSVSSHHCQIEVNDGVITVWDLDSTNGTFINDQPIRQGVLQPGQVLRLGTVPMICQSEDPVPVAPGVRVVASPPPLPAATAAVAPVIAAVTPGDLGVCAQHPQAPAKWCCVKCGTPSCAACVKTTRVGGEFFRACPRCGGSCVSVAEYQRLMKPPTTNFFGVWGSAFGYPLRKDGAILLVCGTIVFSFLGGATWVLSHVMFAGGIIGVAYILCLVMTVGYSFSFMQNVVQSSARGDEAMPDWPEISAFWDDMVVPFFRFLTLWLVCLGPGVGVLFLSPAAGIGLLLLGLFCLPMAILTVSMADSIGGLNPFVVFSGIGKAPLPYLATCGVFLLVIAVTHGTQMLLEWTGIPIIPTVLSSFISLYGISVEMRLLGLLYYTNKSKLAWFE